MTYYVYIMTNQFNTVLYVGVTNDLNRRAAEHQLKQDGKSFTARYNLTKLVYFEEPSDVSSVLIREKQLKGGSRLKKVDLVRGMNPEWRDLSEGID